MKKIEKPKLVNCPECGHKTLLVSEKAKFNSCTNKKCYYFEKVYVEKDEL